MRHINILVDDTPSTQRQRLAVKEALKIHIAERIWPQVRSSYQSAEFQQSWVRIKVQPWNNDLNIIVRLHFDTEGEQDTLWDAYLVQHLDLSILPIHLYAEDVSILLHSHDCCTDTSDCSVCNDGYPYDDVEEYTVPLANERIEEVREDREATPV
jgi:hypothetical protein